MTTMLSLILAFMLSIGGSPAASVNPAGCPGDTGIQAPDNNTRTINRFFEDYNQKTASRPISKKILEIPLIKHPKTQIRLRFSLFLKGKLRLMGYIDSMNLYQALNMNPVNFVDPMGTVVNPNLVKHYGSLMAAEHNVRVTYSRFRQSGDSHADAYNKLLDYGFVTHTGIKDDEIFEFSLSTSPMYGSPKARKTPKKRPTAETIGDFAAGFGDEIAETSFDLLEGFYGVPSFYSKKKPKIVLTKIYRELLGKAMGLGEIEDMVDYDSPAYEMGGYTWHGTAFTLGALESTYSSSNLLADIEFNLSHGDDIYVIGRKFDTAIAKDWPGYKILDETGWSIQRNDEYIQMIINKRAKVYIASPKTPKNLWNFEEDIPTIFSIELEKLKAAGYIEVGQYLIPPQ